MYASQELALPVKPARTFLPETLVFDSWSNLEQHFENLLHRTISSAADLKKWVEDLSELEAVLSEETGWRYIRMNIDTSNAENTKAFEFLVTEIDPKVAPYSDKFNQMLVESPFLKALNTEG